MSDEIAPEHTTASNSYTPQSSTDSSLSTGAAISLANQIPSLSIFSSGSLSLLCQCVDFSEISFKEKVGHGSYGTVYKSVWRDRFVAVKEFEPNADVKAVETEVKQLSRVQHSNIIALFGITHNQLSTYLIMEYAEGGSLHDFLHGNVKPPYSTAHAMSWARQCAEGVAYLHAMKPKPLIHRDLKPLNLLLTDKGRHLKICDFGTVADKSTLMTNNKGSAAWMAPEVFEGSKYTEKCDIFSWSIVLWEVLSRQKPFKDVDNTLAIMWKIHKGERPTLIPNLPEPIEKLMTSCWAPNPVSRPSMQHVVEVMNEFVKAFTGADEPLEYEFINQQIISAHSTEGDNYDIDFSSFSNATSCGTQVTQQHNSGSLSTTPTPTNPSGTNPFLPNSTAANASIDSYVKWDVIPEEPDSGYLTNQIDDDTRFNFRTSEESKQRYQTIRNSMLEKGIAEMPPLTLDIDSNAWELDNNDNATIAKSDGKERIMVTEAKNILKSSEAKNPNIPIDSGETVPDEDEDNGQSWHEMLDPELQPEQPINDNPESQEIYREHRRLAKEYLRVDTKLYYAQDFKEKFLIQMDPQERQEKQELLKKMKEKEELLELYNNIKQQWETMRSDQPIDDPTRASVNTSQNGDLVPDDSWVVIGHNNRNS